MNKKVKTSLLFSIVLLQILTIVGGFIAYKQMSDMYSELALSYKELYEERYGIIIDYGFTPNLLGLPFLLLLLCLFLTITLLIDETFKRESEQKTRLNHKN